jgi:hypothetical protein
MSIMWYAYRSTIGNIAVAITTMVWVTSTSGWFDMSQANARGNAYPYVPLTHADGHHRVSPHGSSMLCGMARSPTFPIVQCVHSRPHPLPLRGVSERNGSQAGTASLAQSDRVNVFGRLMA